MPVGELVALAVELVFAGVCWWQIPRLAERFDALPDRAIPATPDIIPYDVQTPDTRGLV